MYNTDSIMGASKYAIVTQATMLTAFYTQKFELAHAQFGLHEPYYT